MAIGIDSVVNPLLSKLIDYLFDRTVRQVAYVTDYKSNVDELRRQVRKLEADAEHIQHSVDEGLDNGKNTEKNVRDWLHEAEKVVKDGKELLENGNVSCFHPVTRYRRGKKVVRTNEDIGRLAQEGNFESVSYQHSSRPRRRAGIVTTADSSKASGQHIVALKSRESILKKIMDALDDDNVDIIGVHGMGGVGKTTLVKEVSREAIESKKFKEVVMIVVSQTPILNRIREDVVEVLDRVKSEEDSDMKNSSRKKVLIILDDLWKKLDLKEIGITYGDSKMKIKLVLTSRYLHVLTDGMNAQPYFHLDILSKEDSWKLFAEIVGDRFIKSRKANRLSADELNNKCGGLPILIEALAMIFKNNSDSTWEDALKDIKASQNGQSAIELSYKYLEDKEGQAKLLFRICGLLGSQSIPIQNLFRYSIGLRSLGGRNMIGARREVRKLLVRLQDSSLLLDSDIKDHVKIHDLARDFAVQIATRDDNALVLRNVGGSRSWSGQDLEKSLAISMCTTSIQELPEQGWNCPKLETFILHLNRDKAPAAPSKGDYVQVPERFFQGMQKLKVLDLKYAWLSSLPRLHNLVTLCLDYCHLEELTGIGELNSLKILSFIGSDIALLPKEIGKLTSLRSLELSKCSKLEAIESGLWDTLDQLEELYLENSFAKWEVDGVASHTNCCLAELDRMPKLNTLVAHVPDISMLPADLPFDKLFKYRIHIGDAWDWSDDHQELRTLKIQLNCSDILFEERSQATLRSTEDLYLSDLNGTNRSIHELCIDGFRELKHLHVQNSPSIQYIVRSMELFATDAFTTLESLILKNMPCLEKISRGLLKEKSFSKLKVVKVNKCENLKSIFTLSVVKGLQELEEIEVDECNKMEEVVIDEETESARVGESGCCKNLKNLFCLSCKCIHGGDGVDKAVADDEVKLNKLRHLTLKNLKMVTAFFNKNPDMENASGQESSDLATLFNGRHVFFPGLESLTLSSLPEVRGIWQSSQPPMELGYLRSLQLKDCKKISIVINSKMLRKLQKLESLVIEDCELIQEIFDFRGLDMGGGNVDVLPQLSELKLKRLPKLMRIWNKNPKGLMGFQRFMLLEVDDCPNLKSIFTPSMTRAMEKLAEIEIVNCETIKGIVVEEDDDLAGALRLPSLKTLRILDCPKMNRFLFRLQRDRKCDRCRSCLGKHREEDDKAFFDRKVVLPDLEDLILSLEGDFSELWHSELVSDKSFCKLARFGIRDCVNLRSVFPATLIERLQNLKELVVTKCFALEAILDTVHVKDVKCKPLMLPRLKVLMLEDLQNLRHVVESDKRVAIGFPSLRIIELRNCQSLQYLTPNVTAETLSELEILEIADCPRMWEIVAPDESGRNQKEGNIFPHLNSLKLTNLGNLICFSSASDWLGFPNLKELAINKCPALKSLCPDSASEREPLFNEKVALWNLENLHIREVKVENLWHKKPLARSLCKLKYLKVEGCPNLQTVVPPFMFERLQSLQSLRVSRCDRLEGLYEFEGSGMLSNRRKSMTSLKFMRILACPVLKNLLVTSREDRIVKDSELRKAAGSIHFPQLTCLELYDLPQLCFSQENFSFPSVKQWRVCKCDALGAIATGLEGRKEREDIEDSGIQIQHRRTVEKAEKILAPAHLISKRKPAVDKSNYGLVFQSRSKLSDDIMKELRREDSTIIGVQGKYGMGKTSLMRLCKRKFVEDELFDEVLMVALTDTLDVKTTQAQIASQLGLSFHERMTVAERAHLLYERLLDNPGKRVLIILEDIKAELDLNAIGIPCDETVKVLLTSRLENALVSTGAQRVFRLKPLEPIESWRLFQEKIGKKSLETGGFLMEIELATAAKLCQNLPLAIISLASLLKDRSLPEMQQILREMD